MDDEELVRQLLLGNRGAYADLVKRYTAQIAALCHSHIPRREVVEDLVQETFFRGLDGIAGLREPKRFGYWLYAIARNLCRDWLRDPGHEHVSLEAVPLQAAVEPTGEEDPVDRSADLKQCVALLPLELREIVEIYYSGGRTTYHELADRLDISYALVNKQLTRARKLLRTCLERNDSGR